jgi:hypothetical protein
MAFVAHSVENPCGDQSGSVGWTYKGLCFGEKTFSQFCLCQYKGKQAKTAAYEPQFFEPLNYVWARHLALFPPDINTEDDYGISRRLGQWGLSLEAVNQGISVKIIELICGWPVKW